MAKYVSLINWTDQGIKSFKETTARAADAATAFEKAGGKLAVYWTIGSYDIVAIAEAPDDETATAILLQLGSLGNVRTQTMRAFDTEEMSGIIAKTA
jgi:uncharacterized protein with GYD domain